MPELLSKKELRKILADMREQERIDKPWFDAYEAAIKAHPEWKQDFYDLCDKRKVDCSHATKFLKAIRDFLKAKKWPLPNAKIE